MALGKKAGAIVTLSGDIVMKKEVTSIGIDATPKDTFALLSHVEDGSGPSDKQPITKRTTEAGGVVKLVYGDREVTVDGMFQQSDKDLIDFLTDGCRDKFFAIYRYEGIVNGFHQEYFYGIGQFTPQMELKSGAKLIPFEITIMRNENAITILNADLPTGHHISGLSDVVIPADKYYVIVETAV